MSDRGRGRGGPGGGRGGGGRGGRDGGRSGGRGPEGGRGGPPGAGRGFEGGRGGPPGAGRGGPPAGGRGPPGGGGRGPGGPGGRDGGRGGGRGRGPQTQEMDLNQAVREMSMAIQGLQLVPNEPRWHKDLGLRRAVRPGFGKAGRPVTIMTNHFPIMVKAPQAYQYDINIEPVPKEGRPVRTPKPGEAPRPMGSKVVRRILTQVAVEQRWPQGWASDGQKNLYAARQFLPEGEATVSTTLVDPDGDRAGGREFKVTTKLVQIIDMTLLQRFISGENIDMPQSALSVLDVVFRNGVSARDEVQIIRSSVFFHVPNSDYTISLGGGLEAWAGYKQAVRPCQFGLSLNLDLAATAFLEAKPLHALAADLVGYRGGLRELNDRGLGRTEIQTLTKVLRNVRVEVTVQDRTRRHVIRGFSQQGADQLRFHCDEMNGEVTVAQYFRQKYGIALQYEWLQCVDVGRENHHVWQPMELVKVAKGQRRLKLNEAQTTAMLGFAGVKPAFRRGYLQEVVDRRIGWQQDPAVAAFGIQVSKEMKTLQARILPQPRLQYGRPQSIDPGPDGSWNLKSTVFPRPSAVKSWAVLSLAPRNDVDIQGETGLPGFMRDLVQMLKSTGCTCDPPPILYSDRQRSMYQMLAGAADAAQKQFQLKCQIILVLLPSQSQQTYREVKTASDSELGIPSQCFVTRKAGLGARSPPPRGRLQYCANLALKINAKVGGVNVQLSAPANKPAMFFPVIGAKPYMLLGADVTHGMAGSNMPSVAAVTASMDAFLGHYSCRVQLQPRRGADTRPIEVIINMRDAVKELLVEFSKANRGMKPEAIVYYRDGVGEGQFRDVVKHEYESIRKACNELTEGYTPPITFIIVQKRHNTRFFPVDQNQVKDNCMPGTVVDQTITHPRQFDFFLNSHAGLQGHNKAAHYNVQVDENGFPADALQLFTYWLCYLYCRCTRSVSNVPPAYYAHLAAFRGRLMVDVSDDSSVSSAGEGGGTQFARIHQALINTMFYV